MDQNLLAVFWSKYFFLFSLLTKHQKPDRMSDPYPCNLALSYALCATYRFQACMSWRMSWAPPFLQQEKKAQAEALSPMKSAQQTYIHNKKGKRRKIYWRMKRAIDRKSWLHTTVIATFQQCPIMQIYIVIHLLKLHLEVVWDTYGDITFVAWKQMPFNVPRTTI